MASLSAIADATRKFGLPLVTLICLSAWIQGFRSFPWFAVILHLKEDLGLDSVASQVLISSVFLPINLKPIYGLLSDGLHLAGISRFRHLLVCSVLVAASWAALFCVPFLSASTIGLTVVLFAGNIASSCVDVITDAILVQASKSEGQKSAGNLQSLAWLSGAAGGVIGALVSGPAHEALKPVGMFGAFAVLPIAQIGLCTLLEDHNRQDARSKVDEQQTIRMSKGIIPSDSSHGVNEQSRTPARHDEEEKGRGMAETEGTCLTDIRGSKLQVPGEDEQAVRDDCATREDPDSMSGSQERDPEAVYPVQLLAEQGHGGNLTERQSGAEGSEEYAAPESISQVPGDDESMSCRDSIRGDRFLQETRGNDPVAATEASGLPSSLEHKLEDEKQCSPDCEGTTSDMIGVQRRGERIGRCAPHHHAQSNEGVHHAMTLPADVRSGEAMAVLDESSSKEREHTDYRSVEGAPASVFEEAGEEVFQPQASSIVSDSEGPQMDKEVFEPQVRNTGAGSEGPPMDKGRQGGSAGLDDECRSKEGEQMDSRSSSSSSGALVQEEVFEGRVGSSASDFEGPQPYKVCQGESVRPTAGLDGGHPDACHESPCSDHPALPGDLDDWEVVEKGESELETPDYVQTSSVPATTAPLSNVHSPILERLRERAVGGLEDNDALRKDAKLVMEVGFDAPAASGHKDSLSSDPATEDVHGDVNRMNTESTADIDRGVESTPQPEEMEMSDVAESSLHRGEAEAIGHCVTGTVGVEIDSTSVQTDLVTGSAIAVGLGHETEEEVHKGLQTAPDQHCASMRDAASETMAADETRTPAMEGVRYDGRSEGMAKEEVSESGAEKHHEKREQGDGLRQDGEMTGPNEESRGEGGLMRGTESRWAVDDVEGRDGALEAKDVGTVDSEESSRKVGGSSSLNAAAVDRVAGAKGDSEVKSVSWGSGEKQRVREGGLEVSGDGIRQRVTARQVSSEEEIDVQKVGQRERGSDALLEVGEKMKRRNIQAELLRKLCLLWETLKNPTIHRTLLWYFLADALVPAVGNCVTYFQLDVLKMGAAFLGYSRVLGWVGLIAATLIFNRYLKGARIQPFVCRVQVAMALFTFTDTIVITRINRIVSIPDGAFIFGANSVGIPIGQLKLMPFFVYSARVCPPGLEGSLFAVYTSICTIGGTIGAYLGAALAGRLNISSESYDNLALGVAIQSACCLLPLLFLFLIPSGICAVPPPDSCPPEGGQEKKAATAQLKED